MLFSIVVATYNAEELLPQCLDSIARQSWSDYETIVVDGGSKDLTTEIASAHPVVNQLISEPDDGIYDAWNKGIHTACGQWILFVGADDCLLPDALGTLAEVCQSEPELDYVSGRMLLVDVQGRSLREVGTPWSWRFFRRGMNVAHPCSAHNRKLYEAVGLYDTSFKVAGDYELLLRKGDKLKAAYVDLVLCRFRVGGVSYLNARALLERYLAKKKTGSEPMLNNFLSFCWSYTKMISKIGLLKIGLIKV